MGKIVAIGGGELKDLDTLPLDKEIVKLTGKQHPVALFIPTASGDAEGYWQTFQKVYRQKLGCKTEVLYLIREKNTKREIENKILEVDLIYVGGGNTLKMLKIWKKQGVDKLLTKAYEQGVVLSGLSAGAICWFRYGCSDSRRFSNPEDASFMKVKGLNLVNLTVSPHHIREKNRDKGLVKLMQKTSGVGIALDDNCALEIVDGNYRMLSSKNGAGAKKIYYSGGKPYSKKIDITEKYSLLSDLMKK
ncbi:MAG: Type 1 glutamine amidotransferase-like domain-containing protein [Nanoarchaeota archaeon]|nr:Type 1 glutamine amidotransferase-like domain-containing protein [Nanoarchaeota archaeon]